MNINGKNFGENADVYVSGRSSEVENFNAIPVDEAFINRLNSTDNLIIVTVPYSEPYILENKGYAKATVANIISNVKPFDRSSPTIDTSFLTSDPSGTGAICSPAYVVSNAASCDWNTAGGQTMTLTVSGTTESNTNHTVEFSKYDSASGKFVKFGDCSNVKFTLLGDGPGVDPTTLKGQIVCTTPPGDGKGDAYTLSGKIYQGISVFILRNSQPGVPILIQYAAPTFDKAVVVGSQANCKPNNIDSVSCNVMGGIGGELTIYGNNFGVNPTVYLESKVLTITSRDAGHTWIKLQYPSGSGFNFHLRIEVSGGVVSTNFILIGYLPPIITSYSPVGPFDTNGGDVITIQGVNFGGLASKKPLVTVGGRVAEVSSYADNVIVFTVPPGFGKNEKLVISANGQTSSNAQISYNAPVVSSLTPSHVPSSGNQNITLLGKYLGADVNGLGNAASYSITIQPKPGSPANTFQFLSTITSERFLKITSTSIILNLPEYQGEVDLILNLGNQQSNPMRFNFDKPKVDQISPNHGSTDGLFNITLSGTSFGKRDNRGAFTVEVSIGHYLCRVNVQTHTQIICTISPGVGGKLPVKITQHTLSGPVIIDTGITFSFDLPNIDCNDCGFFPNTIDSSGTTIYLCGKNFGASKEIAGDIIVAFPSEIRYENGFILPPSPDYDANCTNIPIVWSPDTPPTAQWSKDANHCSGAPYISCDVPPLVVGNKNVTITIGNQTAAWLWTQNSNKSPKLSSRCVRGWYGLTNEYCLDCSAGVFGENTEPSANCTDAKEKIWGGEPVSTQGWWKFDSTNADLCALQNRTLSIGRPKCYVDPKTSVLECQNSCPGMLPCTPKESCLGNNQCAVGYTFLQDQCQVSRTKLNLPLNCTTDLDCLVDKSGNSLAPVCSYDNAAACSKCVNKMCSCMPYDPFTKTGTNLDEFNGGRCALCTAKKFYRAENECVKCPEIQTWEMVVGALFACFCAFSAYKFTKSGVSMALASIAIDYFQVLSMFSKTKISWPQELKTLFKMLSIFNFNLELFPPECFFKSVDFSTKWFGIQLFPLAAAVCFLIYHFWRVAMGLCMRKDVHDEFVWTHLSPFINTSVTCFYFMYMYLLRMQLDIVACTPTNPNDGYLYTSFTSHQCGGLCKCWQKGSLQMTLLPYSFLAFFVYSVGFGYFLYKTLMRNRVNIVHDQIIKAYISTNPGTHYNINHEVLEVSKRYNRLYFRFHPDYHYWSLVVLARKLGICMTALFYTQNPSFQFGLTLLIMFASYVMQVKHKPYMSEKNHGILLKEHKKRVDQYKKFNELHPESEERAEMEVHKLAKMHYDIEQSIMQDLSFAKKHKVQHLDELDTLKKQEAAAIAVSWLTSYNTVEACLLICSVLVCLIGMKLFHLIYYCHKYKYGSTAININMAVLP